MSVGAYTPDITLIMPGDAIERALRRMAHQIREQDPDLSRVVLIGIRTRGGPLARRLQSELERIGGERVRVGEMDITSYRDDLSRRDIACHVSTDLDFSVQGLTVVLVDDVLFTGRTARAAMDALVDHGRPARIRLAALVDRGHRELPIRADYVGKNLPSALDEEVQVRLAETDGADAVLLVRRGEVRR